MTEAFKFGQFYKDFKMKQIAQRFKEPSSWAGISVLLSLAAPHLGLTVDMANAIIQVGIAVAGALAIGLPENQG